MRQTFSDLITGRRMADQSVTVFLERLVTQYPYCQAGQMLYAKALQQSADPSFDQQMNLAMAAAPDRRHFRSFLSEQPERGRVYHQVYDPEELLYSAPAWETGETTIPGHTAEAGEATGGGEAGNPDQATSSTGRGKTPGPGSGPASDQETGHKTRQQEIIDRFLSKNPRIEGRKGPIPEEEMAPESLDDHPELISETLAGIHLKQGKTGKAIDIYKKLSLKFPEKSSYFAKKIRSIERNAN
ncbi:MAG: hypothetical protein ACLFS0_09515 [Bacteroidales bacterium]